MVDVTPAGHGVGRLSEYRTGWSKMEHIHWDFSRGDGLVFKELDSYLKLENVSDKIGDLFVISARSKEDK